jgi:hypothetical protein
MVNGERVTAGSIFLGEFAVNEKSLASDDLVTSFFQPVRYRQEWSGWPPEFTAEVLLSNLESLQAV